MNVMSFRCIVIERIKGYKALRGQVADSSIIWIFKEKSHIRFFITEEMITG